MSQRFGIAIVTCLSLGGVMGLTAQGQQPSPGVVVGGFCSYPTGLYRTSTQAAQHINQYFVVPFPVGSEIFHVGVAPYVYTWQKTNTTTSVGRGKNTVQVNEGVAKLQQAIGTAGEPGAFSEQNVINPTDMGTGGILASQALALEINQGFSQAFVTPATGLPGLSLVNMSGIELDGTALTSTQVAALNGQAIQQIREASDRALGRSGPMPYDLSFSQLTDLLALLNGSFEFCAPSIFAEMHLYQPYVTSNVLPGPRPSTISTFAYKPTYHTFSGEIVYVGRGCPGDTYLADATDKIALIERGACRFDIKVAEAQVNGAAAAIIFNNAATAGCPATPTPGSNQCEALVGMGGTNRVVLPSGTVDIVIPAAFVQRSTGLLLQGGSTTAVNAFVQQ